MKNYKALIIAIVCQVIIAVLWLGPLLFSPRQDLGLGGFIIAIPIIIISVILNIVSIVYLAKFIDSFKK